jgi:6-phosphogluconolactonase
MRSYKIKQKEEAGMLVKILLESFPSDKTELHIGIPGGRSILPVLEAFKEVGKATLEKCKFYLVDERIHEDRNQDMLREAFFNEAINKGLFKEEQIVFPEFTDNLQEDLKRYGSKIPERFDLVIFGVGEDGHIASLFPGSEALESEHHIAYINDSPKPPAERVTLTFKAFSKETTTVLLFLGEEKKNALKSVMEADVNECPAAYFIESENTHVITDNDVP